MVSSGAMNYKTHRFSSRLSGIPQKHLQQGVKTSKWQLGPARSSSGQIVSFAEGC